MSCKLKHKLIVVTDKTIKQTQFMTEHDNIKCYL